MPNDQRLRTKWLGTESNCRHGDFQYPALPTELPSHASRCLASSSGAPFTRRFDVRQEKKVLKCKKNIQTDTQPQVEYVQAVQMIFVFFVFGEGEVSPCASISAVPQYAATPSSDLQPWFSLPVRNTQGWLGTTGIHKASNPNRPKRPGPSHDQPFTTHPYQNAKIQMDSPAQAMKTRQHVLAGKLRKQVKCGNRDRSFMSIWSEWSCLRVSFPVKNVACV